MTIVAQQNRPVSLEQVRVTGGTISGENGRFVVRVNTDTIVGITVKTKAGEVTWHLRSKRIVPVASLSMRHRGNTRLGNGEFKAQGGIIPVFENGGDCINVKCDVVSFSVLRITKDDKVFRAENQGASFGQATRPIINLARPGDLYWFRHILVRCPGQEPQLLDDISVAVD